MVSVAAVAAAVVVDALAVAVFAAVFLVFLVLFAAVDFFPLVVLGLPPIGYLRGLPLPLFTTPLALVETLAVVVEGFRGTLVAMAAVVTVVVVVAAVVVATMEAAVEAAVGVAVGVAVGTAVGTAAGAVVAATIVATGGVSDVAGAVVVFFLEVSVPFEVIVLLDLPLVLFDVPVSFPLSDAAAF